MAEVQPYTPRQERIGDAVIKVMSRVQSAAYRWTGGRVGGRFLRGAPVAVLHHTGRRTGEPRTSPLLYVERGDDVIVAASKGGFTGNPGWYYNLLATPDCVVQTGTRRRPVRARIATEDERPALWARLDAVYADFAEYRARAALAGREIPLFVLEPR